MTTIGVIWGLSSVFSFLAARSSYYILKFLAGAAWVASALVWSNLPPANVVAGSPVHTIIMLLLWIFGIAFMLYPFWRTNGDSIGKIVPFWRSQDDEDEREKSRHFPTRQERNDAYSERVKSAINGKR